MWTLNKGRQLWELAMHWDTWLISIWKITLQEFCYYQLKEPHPPSNCCFWVSILVDNSRCWLVDWAKLTCDLCTAIAWSCSLRNIWLLPELTPLIICMNEIDKTIISGPTKFSLYQTTLMVNNITIQNKKTKNRWDALLQNRHGVALSTLSCS